MVLVAAVAIIGATIATCAAWSAEGRTERALLLTVGAAWLVARLVVGLTAVLLLAVLPIAFLTSADFHQEFSRFELFIMFIVTAFIGAGVLLALGVGVLAHGLRRVPVADSPVPATER